jgi:hypothetical protein
MVTMPAVTEAAAAEHVRATKPAAAETAEMTAAVTATTAMTAANFGREPFGRIFRRGHRRRIDQRQRFRALAGEGRQGQHRDCHKSEAADDAAPEIAYFFHP